MNKKIKLTESELIGDIKEIRNNIALRRRFSDGLDDNEIKDMNIQENIQRIKLMMGLIKEEGALICKHCDERTKKLFGQHVNCGTKLTHTVRRSQLYIIQSFC